MKTSPQWTAPGRERALLVQAIIGHRANRLAADSLDELERLTDSAGAQAIGRLTQRRPRPNPSLLVGEGKLADIQLACRQGKADVVIFDNELSAVQVNNLDLALGVRVIDRTELILQIFARRARTAEAKLQVELAQLEYLVQRIPVSRKQQRFQGGIGMRGPGESPLELRNAPMRRRIRDLKSKLQSVQARRAQTRRRRKWPVVSLVGYTNAGKSTLLNAFTSADAYVDDRLFATLDTKTRLVYLGGDRKVLMSDTVGFIRHLPHGLVASFRSTLEEAGGADVLVIVADVSDPAVRDHLAVVQQTLADIGAAEVPAILAFNKCDRAGAEAAFSELRREYPASIAVSAADGSGLDRIKSCIAACLSERLPHSTAEALIGEPESS